MAAAHAIYWRLRRERPVGPPRALRFDGACMSVREFKARVVNELRIRERPSRFGVGIGAHCSTSFRARLERLDCTLEVRRLTANASASGAFGLSCMLDDAHVLERYCRLEVRILPAHGVLPPLLGATPVRLV